MTPPFSPALYPLWCRAWLLLTASHAQRLEQWLSQRPPSEIVAHIQVAHSAVAQTLNVALLKLENGTINDATLLQLFGCLRELEAWHCSESRRLFRAPQEVSVHAVRYVLLSPNAGTVRAAYPGQQFKLSGQIANAGALDLQYRWVPLQERDELDWKRLPDLDQLRAAGRLRVGLAPCAFWGDMAWRIDDHEQRGLHGRAPLQCEGARDAAALWAVVEQALAAAHAQQVQMLLFPELVFDAEMLRRTRAWLVAHNLAVPRLRLVVAGSRHCQEESGESGWSNRCTVLGQGGHILWEQDKRTTFVQDDAAVLALLQAGCQAVSAFEPTRLGKRVVVRESAVGRLLSPICLDYIEGELWANLGADMFLVPAMTGRLARFAEKAKEMGKRHGAASFVCNAQTGGEDRQLCYLPITGAHQASRIAGQELFTIDVNFRV